MTAFRLPVERDPAHLTEAAPLQVLVDGVVVTGRAGQSIAGLLLSAGRLEWRTTTFAARPRGVFCGIGVCFDCLVVVNGVRDVRACLRRAVDADVITRQDDAPAVPGHDPDGSRP